MEDNIAAQFAGMKPKITFGVSCPTCGAICNSEIAENKFAGLTANRKNSLAADIVILKNQIANMNPKKEQASIIIMDCRLLKLEQELFELGQDKIWFNDEFITLRSL